MASDEEKRKQGAEKLYREKFADWWERDYSVEGLKSKYGWAVDGRHFEQHEYWASDLEVTVKFAGREWTLFHLPMHDLAGNPSPKASWTPEQVSKFYERISIREAEGSADYRQRMSGVHPPLAHFDGVVFPQSEYVHAQGAVSASYQDAIFDGAVSVRHAENFANFSNAIFRGPVCIENANFSNGASFSKSLFIADATFQGTTFADTDFGGAMFLARANFRGAHFGYAHFRAAVFTKRAEFVDGSSNGAVFNGCEFADEADFSRHKFTGGLDADTDDGRKAIFSRDVWFRDCVFQGAVTLSAKFERNVDFSSGAGGAFAESLNVDETEFCGAADFTGRQFHRPTLFSRTLFKRAPQFHAATPHSSTTFTGCTFKGTLGDVPEWAFQWGKSRVVVAFARTVELFWPTRKLWALWWAMRAAEATQRWSFRWAPFAEWLPSMETAQIARNANTRIFESAYRTLRHLLENDSEQSGLFYRLEMDTRIRRTDVSIAERLLLILFKLSSGYGRFPGRPLLALTAAITIVTIGLHMAAGSCAATATYEDAFAAAWRFFLLPSPFQSTLANTNPVMHCFLKNPFISLPLSAVCGLITAGVTGVFLITLRRRFALK